MVFPTTVLPVVAQWWIDGAWADMVRGTDPSIPGANGGSALYGMDRGGVAIRWGRTDETRDADTSTCDLQLWNNDGRFTRRNPSGPFYGRFGQNTPMRVGVTADASWLRFTGPGQGSEGSTSSAGARVTAPDSAALSITGDIDVRLDADLDTWVPREDAGVDLVGKWTGTAGQRSWQLVLQVGTGPGGWLAWFWSTDGTATSSAFCTLPLPVTTGRLSVRVAHDVNNGAAGNDVRFYYSQDTDLTTASWTQLGDTVTAAGTTSIFDSTTVVTIGDTATGSQSRTIRGKWYGVEIRNSAGTVVADPDFTVQTAGASSFADTASSPNTWTLTGDVELEDVDWRWHGENPSWRPRRDPSGNDNYVPVSGTGALRRLGMGNQPLQSPMRRSLGARADAVAYWPLEDGRDAEAFGSALANGRVMKWAEAVPNLASDDQFLCSTSLPQSNGARYTGFIRPHTAPGVYNLQLLMYVPAATTDDRMLVRFTTAAGRWDIVYGDISGGSLQLQWYDSAGAFVSETAFVTFGVDDTLLWLSLELTEDVGNTDYKLAVLEVGQETGTQTSGTAAGMTLGVASAVRTGHVGHDPDEVFGHIIVTSSIYSIYDVHEQLNAYIGETAGRRMERLAQENGVQFTWRGDLDATVEMGAQGIATVLQLMREAANTDHGILYEPRDVFGLQYRTRESLSRQAPAAELSYTGHDLSLFEPADDDYGLQNEVTVSRGGVGSPVDGASFSTELTTGPLSTNPPDDPTDPGAGRGYAAAYTVNVNSDTDLPDHATWLLHLGTVDEPRVTGVGVQLQRTSAFADEAARVPLRGIGVGDALTITDLPDTIGTPDDLGQLVQGADERLHQYAHEITWSTSPSSPYDVAAFDDLDLDGDGELARYSSDGTVLAVPLASSTVDFAGSQTLTAPDAAYVGADLDVRVLVAYDDWTPAGESIAAAHYVNTGNQRRWAFGIASTGRPTVFYSTDGSTNTQVTCSAATGFTDGTAHWIRVTIDVDNGAAGRDIKFWTSADGVTWTQLGTTTTTAGTITLFDSTALFQLGCRSGTALTSSMAGVVYGVQVSGTIRTTVLSDGDSVVPFDPADWTAGYTGTGTGATVAEQTSAPVSLSTPSGPLWTTDAAGEDFPFSGRLGTAERVSVTDIDAAGSSTSSRVQVATVTRGQNGVVHAYDAGAAFELWRPVYWGL